MLQWVLIWCLFYTGVHLAESRVDMLSALKVALKVGLASLLLLGVRLGSTYSSMWFDSG